MIRLIEYIKCTFDWEDADCSSLIRMYGNVLFFVTVQPKLDFAKLLHYFLK